MSMNPHRSAAGRARASGNAAPMTIVERIQNASNVIKIVGGVILLFPGIAVLLGLVDIPPSLQDMVRIIAYSACVVVLLAVFLLDEAIRNMTSRRAALAAVLAVLLGGVCIITYFGFANRHVVEISAPEGEENIFIAPRKPSQQILDIVDPPVEGQPSITDYRTALEGSADNIQLKELMKRQSGSSTIVMILLLVLSEILLIAPVVAVAWKLASGPPGRASARRPARRPAGPGAAAGMASSAEA